MLSLPGFADLSSPAGAGPPAEGRSSPQAGEASAGGFAGGGLKRVGRATVSRIP
jgi:hypothetical protein